LKWIGITGSIGTGKSTVAQIIRQLGYMVLDADVIAKNQLAKNSQGYQQVLTTFGDEILTTDNEIDKNKLAKIVFNNKVELHKLESIVHPLVQKEIQKIKSEQSAKGAKALFYDVPLLFEKQMQSQFDEVILIAAEEKNQIQRIKTRNNWSNEEIAKRLSSQMKLEEKRKLSRYVIENDGDLISLQKQIELLLSKII
jgi:dephospho-CoA kinase